MAGIATFVPNYVQQRKEMWRENQQECISRIRSREGILEVMRKLLSVRMDEFHFLRPYKLLEMDFETIDELIFKTLNDL